MNDQAQRLRELAQQKGSPVHQSFTPQPSTGVPLHSPKSIAVTSGKGGVGKSNIAIYLASALAATGKRVLLLDADLGLANAHILLGIAPRLTLSDVIDETCTIENVITPAPGGFDIIPGASGIEKLANIDTGRLQLLMRSFSRTERNYDYLIADTGAGIGATVTQFASAAECALIVMTPEPTSLADAYAMVKILYERGARRLGIIVNMAASDRDGVETFDKLNALVVKFLKRPVEHYGTLPYCREVGKYVRRQQLPLQGQGETAFIRRVGPIARRVGGSGGAAAKGFFERLWSPKR